MYIPIPIPITMRSIKIKMEMKMKMKKKTVMEMVQSFFINLFVPIRSYLIPVRNIRMRKRKRKKIEKGNLDVKFELIFILIRMTGRVIPFSSVLCLYPFRYVSECVSTISIESGSSLIQLAFHMLAARNQG